MFPPRAAAAAPVECHWEDSCLEPTPASYFCVAHMLVKSW